MFHPMRQTGPAFHFFSGFSNRVSLVLPKLVPEHHDYVPDPVALLGQHNDRPAVPAGGSHLYQTLPLEQMSVPT